MYWIGANVLQKFIVKNVTKQSYIAHSRNDDLIWFYLFIHWFEYCKIHEKMIIGFSVENTSPLITNASYYER